MEITEQNSTDVEKIHQHYEHIIATLQAQLSLIEKRCEHYSHAYDSLQHQLHELLRHRFGKKSERYIDPESPQLNLFENNAALFSTQDAIENVDEKITIPTHTRTKKKNNTKELPRRIEIIPVDEAEKNCHCGACKTVIRYETKELIHYQAAVVEVIEQRREVVACPAGCEGAMVTAPAPLHVLPKTKVTESFLAFVAVSKLDDRQPLYHLEKQLSQRYGVDCSRQSMARWMIELMKPLQPIYNLLKEHCLDYDVASCDATTLQVLNEPGRRAETKSYVYCFRGGTPTTSVILYEYNAALHKDFVNEWFAGFTGYLHVDGDNFFDTVGQVATLVNCNAHARRKFEPIASATKGKGIAKEALRFFKALYKIERDAKQNQFNAEQRYALRQAQSKPLLEKFKNWLDEIYPTVLPQSPLGKAIQYCLNRWSGLTRFLQDGRLEIDNNLTEQEIKPLVIARKNFLFASSIDGAKSLCLHLSLIRTAKLHGLDPYHYYVFLLKRLPHCRSVEDYEKLLPWECEKNLEKI